jgi:hypothetical protein
MGAQLVINFLHLPLASTCIQPTSASPFGCDWVPYAQAYKRLHDAYLITMGNMETGNCSRLKRESATKALAAVSSWPVNTNRAKAANDTSRGEVAYAHENAGTFPR